MPHNRPERTVRTFINSCAEGYGKMSDARSHARARPAQRACFTVSHVCPSPLGTRVICFEQVVHILRALEILCLERFPFRLSGLAHAVNDGRSRLLLPWRPRGPERRVRL